MSEFQLNTNKTCLGSIDSFEISDLRSSKERSLVACPSIFQISQCHASKTSPTISCNLLNILRAAVYCLECPISRFSELVQIECTFCEIIKHVTAVHRFQTSAELKLTLVHLECHWPVFLSTCD